MKIYLLSCTSCWGLAIHLLPPRAITQVRRKSFQNNLCLLLFSCRMAVLLLLLLTSPNRRHWQPGLLAAPSPLAHHTAAQWAPPEFSPCVLGQSDSGPASPAAAQGGTPTFVSSNGSVFAIVSANQEQRSSRCSQCRDPPLGWLLTAAGSRERVSSSTMTFSRLSRLFSQESLPTAGTLSVPLFSSINELGWLAALLLQFLQAAVTPALPPHTFWNPKQWLLFSLSWPFSCPSSAAFYQ